MRKTEITVHNNQRFEVFTQPCSDGFDLWTVATVNGRRMVLDHRLTHDDLEARLAYAQPGDLIWREVALSELPTEKHPSAVEMEGSVKRGVFIDYVDQPNQLLAYHLTSIFLIPIDRKIWNFAKKAVIGKWTDGVAMGFPRFGGQSLLISCVWSIWWLVGRPRFGSNKVVKIIIEGDGYCHPRYGRMARYE